MGDWKEKFPNAKHPPNPDCPRCKGVGYRWFETKQVGDVTIVGHDSPCTCIFIDHDFADEAAQMLGDLARSELRKLECGL